MLRCVGKNRKLFTLNLKQNNFCNKRLFMVFRRARPCFCCHSRSFDVYSNRSTPSQILARGLGAAQLRRLCTPEACRLARLGKERLAAGEQVPQGQSGPLPGVSRALGELQAELAAQLSADMEYVGSRRAALLQSANTLLPDTAGEGATLYWLRRACGHECGFDAGLGLLGTALMSTAAEHDLADVNANLRGAAARRVLSETALLMLHATRAAQSGQCIDAARRMQHAPGLATARAGPSKTHSH